VIGRDARSAGGEVARRLLAFAVAAAVFLLLPSQLHGDVGTVHGFTWQEAFDLLTPIAVISPLWLAFDRMTMTRRSTVVILTLAAIWIAAQGLHLGTNAIGDLFDPGPSREAFYQTAPGALDLWFDEVLSHWLWHLAWAALLLSLAVVAYRVPVGEAAADRRADITAGVGGVIHGLTWMVVTIEGSTSLLGIPTAAAILGLGFGLRTRGPTARVVGVFLMASGVVALALYGRYIARYGWPPPELTQTILGG
jgi:hypothetical protein